jgi:hypothetical protein
MENNFVFVETKTAIFAHLKKGLVVQLVRIPACHAGGREFESRPDRQSQQRLRHIRHRCFLPFYHFSIS